MTSSQSRSQKGQIIHLLIIIVMPLLWSIRANTSHFAPAVSSILFPPHLSVVYCTAQSHVTLSLIRAASVDYPDAWLCFVTWLALHLPGDDSCWLVLVRRGKEVR